MKIILSPAKKMNVDTEILQYIDLPEHLPQTEEILSWLRTKSFAELKKLWGCNEKIAELNYERLKQMNLYQQLTSISSGNAGESSNRRIQGSVSSVGQQII